MAKKKIILFIVEGPSDETSLSTVLTPERIVSAVWDQVKAFMGVIYRKSDICRIVHLADTDGVFIPDSAVVEDYALDAGAYPHYTETQIQTPDPAAILDRNRRKRNNINRLSTRTEISGIPYSMYYFSSNLDHVLHGKMNLSEWEKIRYAEEFDLKYGDDPDGFTLFMKESSFSKCDDYRSSWAFIKTELHSLERYTIPRNTTMRMRATSSSTRQRKQHLTIWR